MPLATPEVAVMVTDPLVTAVTRPADETVATAASDVTHVTVALAIVAPFWSLTVADSWDVAVSGVRLRLSAERVIDVATGVGVEVEVSELGAVVLSPPHAASSSMAVSRICFMYLRFSIRLRCTSLDFGFPLRT